MVMVMIMVIMVIVVNDLMKIILMTNRVDDHDMILPGRPAQHHTRERNPPVQGEFGPGVIPLREV